MLTNRIFIMLLCAASLAIAGFLQNLSGALLFVGTLSLFGAYLYFERNRKDELDGIRADLKKIHDRLELQSFAKGMKG